ncbi:hypothetical protein ACFL08_01470 [Patescibacteria group bacterium]
MKKIKKLSGKIKKTFLGWITFFRENLNKRHLIVVVILVAVLWYGKFLPEVEKVEINKKVSYQTQEGIMLPNITDKKPELIMQNVLRSEKGDFYRIYFDAKADSDETVYVKLRDDMNREEEVQSFSIMGPEDKSSDNQLKRYEIIFESSYFFDELIFYKKDTNVNKDRSDWDEGSVYIHNVKVSRLDIDSQADIGNIIPITVGKSEIIEGEHLKTGYSVNFKKRLSRKNEKVRQFFVSDWNYLTGVNVNLDVVGDGGNGKYYARLGQLNRESRKVEVLREIKFSADEIEKYYYRNGSCFFRFDVVLTKGATYYVEIVNKDVEVDEENYVSLRNISNKNNDYFSIDVARALESDDGVVILNGSKIEDYGSRMTYYYDAQRSWSEALNIYDFKGDMFFDGEDNILANKLREGNYYTYKVDTIYPFEKMRIKARQKKSKEDVRVIFEYSFDNTNWKVIQGSRKNDKSPFEYDLIIDSENKESNVVYFRVSYVGNKNKKSRSFGLSEFNINALLLKKDNSVK